MRLKIIIVILLFCFVTNPGNAQKQTIRTSGDVLRFVPAMAGITCILIHKDLPGAKQFLFSGITAVGLTYLLKHTIKKERPDHSDTHAFPSGHASIAFQSAAFLQKRYGWKFGIPAYALSAYVAWTRVYSKKHDWWDVLAGTVIGIGSSYIFTKPLNKAKISISPTLFDKYPGVHIAFTLQ